MRISEIKIDNFRNLNNIKIQLNELNNYLIGENNLGKSNFLDALYFVFNGKRFEDCDYSDLSKAIEIVVTITLDDGEKGFFGDNFSEENDSEITIKYSQSSSDSYPTAMCLDTGDTIQIKQLKKIHFIRYESTSIPNKELKFGSSNAAGKVFDGIVSKYLSDETHESCFLSIDNINSLTDYVNDMLSKIKGFSQYGIKATVSNSITEVVSDLFYLSDGTRRIETTGSGIQYIAMVTLNILSQIMSIYQSKTMPFDEQVYTNSQGQKLLPLVIALDEPEVHLHPYLQRSLIEYYRQILQNKDTDFLVLLKECFDLDGIDGQLLVVTHSTDILVDDFTSIVRFYKENSITKVVSGMSFKNRFDKGSEKQLHMHFQELKEAFYAHCVIVVEGETEYGCMPYFAKTLGISLDNYCISIIMAQGESSIKPLRLLFNCFHIPCVCVYDGDVQNKRVNDSGINFFTDKLCFEQEIVQNLYNKGQYNRISDIANDLSKQAKNIVLNEDYVRKEFNYLGKSLDGYTPKKLCDVNHDNQDEFCTMYTVFYMKNKGVISGRIYGMNIPADCIPQCYVSVFKKSLELVENDQ